MKRLVVVAALAFASQAFADEGMWTYNNFPAAKVKQKYGFEPTQEWLDKVRLSSARLAGGCSASFVSPNGLVMTNHHCARGCIEQLSSAKKDYLANGFYAKTEAQELQCPAMEVNQLVKITDVTEQLNKATASLSGEAFSKALKAEMAKVEKACAGDDKTKRCDVVTLYQGGKYNLYEYVRYQDVRLVFAPEHAIAFFGGDPDNFEFPRYDLDLTFLRVYKDGKPAPQKHYFKWSQAGAKEGELTFVSGHPGSTSRGLTVAQLEFQRDVVLPSNIARFSELRGMITEFQNRGPEQKRIASNLLFGVENSLKVYKGKLKALNDKAFFATKVKAEQELRQKIQADSAKAKKFGAAWDEIAKAQDQLRVMRTEYQFVEGGAGFQTRLFDIAQDLVRMPDEAAKPNEQRLREYTDSQRPQLEAYLMSKAPIYPELEIAKLTFSLTKMREELGPDHPFVKKVLGKKSPATLAKELVRGSKLANIPARQALLKGGKAAVDASKDPMIALAKLVDADGRAVRKQYEDKIESVVTKNSELIAQAKFDAYGTGIYPDATFTLRLSYGAVKGFPHNGKQVPAFTQMGDAFERHTGEDPFELPSSWLKSQKVLTGSTPMNLVTTNDIIGGNSGSPLINQNAEVVGLVFDGNIQSLGGDFGFDETVNRAVSVDSRAMIESMQKIYGTTRILEELRPGSTKVPAVPSSPAGMP